MEGKLGHAAWRWLFFIEGALTIAVAVIAIPILPDFPNTTRWLTDQERRLAEVRMAEDIGAADEDSETESAMRGLYLALTDWKIWWLAVTLTAFVIGLSFNAYFPTLTATLGYSRTITLLLCAPPWAFATIVSFIVATHSDRTGERFWHIAIPMCLGMLGMIISLSTMNTAARYIALFLQAQSYAGFIVLYSWMSGSIPRPPVKRAVGLGFINAFSQLGNVAGSYVWPKPFGPTYRYSYAITVSMFGLGIIMCFIFRMHLISLNAQLDRGEEHLDPKAKEERRQAILTAAKLEGITEEEAIKKNRGFRYLY
jgi:hypothetical protein